MIKKKKQPRNWMPATERAPQVLCYSRSRFTNGVMCPVPSVFSSTQVALPGWNISTSGCGTQLGPYSPSYTAFLVQPVWFLAPPPVLIWQRRVVLAVLQWLLQCTHHLQLPQNSLGNSGAFQLSESGPQGLVHCIKSRPQGSGYTDRRDKAPYWG